MDEGQGLLYMLITSFRESRIAKAAFVKKKNSKLKLERMVKCSWCVRNYHLVCILLDPLAKPEQP
jgi:hypothetical protein